MWFLNENFHFETTVESHAAVRRNTERSHVRMRVLTGIDNGRREVGRAESVTEVVIKDFFY